MKLLLTERFVPYKGHKIFARLYRNTLVSKNITLVFLHEALGSVAQWREFPKKLGEAMGFDVLIFDRLGHGLSDKMLEKRDVNYLHKEAWEVTPSVLKHFNIENPILFGHSDGATIALLYAARFPTKAVISEAAHVVNDAFTANGINNALVHKVLWIEKLQRFHGKKTKDLYVAWTDTWLADWFQSWQMLDSLPSITCPTLAIQGEKDEYCSAQQVPLMKNGISGRLETLWIPDCGHTPHWEAQALVFEKVVAFLDRHELLE